MSAINFFGKTNMGMIRTNNEDAFIAQTIWDDKHILAVAIDGVGGYEGGEVAAALAQKSIVEYLEKYPDGEREELLKQAVVHANNTIFEERKLQPQYEKMSCVLTAALIDQESRSIFMAHVGDTRLYQYCEGEFRKLSHDHSLVGYREEIGDLTEAEAMAHPQRNIISRDLGSAHWEEDNREIEVNTFPLQPRSILLLCSDGLCDMVTSAQMKEVLEENIPLEEKVQALIDWANVAGGKDNVTVVLVESNLSVDPAPVYASSQKQGKKTAVSSTNRPVRRVKPTKPMVKQQQTKKSSSSKKILLLSVSFVVVAGLFFLLGFWCGIRHGEANATVDNPIPYDTLRKDTVNIDTANTDVTVQHNPDSLAKMAYEESFPNSSSTVESVESADKSEPQNVQEQQSAQETN